MRYIIGVVCAVATFLIGDITGLVIALMVVMALDMLTGVMAAAISHEISSRVGWLGIARKVGMLSIVIVANMIDKYAGMGAHIRDLVVLFYIANEIISLTENCGKLGIKLPDAITRAVASLQAPEPEPLNRNQRRQAAREAAKEVKQ